jgi:hypothetical protein
VKADGKVAEAGGLEFVMQPFRDRMQVVAFKQLAFAVQNVNCHDYRESGLVVTALEAPIGQTPTCVLWAQSNGVETEQLFVVDFDLAALRRSRVEDGASREGERSDG